MASMRGISVGLLAVLSAACSGAHEVGDTGTGGAASSTSASSQSVTSTGPGASTVVSSSTGQGGAGGQPNPPRADVPAIACADTTPDVYITPNNLPTMTDSARGDIVRCASDGPVSVSQVAMQVSAAGASTPMTSGVTIYRIAFRTERGDGSAGVSSARVYLPDTPRALPLPVITVGHPTTGLADNCAPSIDPTSNRDLALPWAGLGYAVIVPDYAGLGNEGAQSYLDNHDQGHAILDGARALRKMLSPGALSSSILAVGYSQGGGAVLSAQSLAKSYGGDGDLVGVIAFAPEWPTRMNSFGFVDMLKNPTELTILTGISENVVATMRGYAYAYNTMGATHKGDTFPVDQQSGFDSAIESLCQIPLGGYLQGVAPTVGRMFDDTLRTSLLACIDGNGSGDGCVEPGKGYYQYLAGNFVTADPTGAPVLFVQGLADYIMPPPSEAACNIQKLVAEGVTPQVCVDPPAQHETVVARNIDFAIQWGLALLGHLTLPTCSSDGMPSCAP